ncbi:MAG: hypothetical protein GXO97_08270 [Nitrospirae bacterium]|nr:hypothetical protein [Nitrospirota bacterium]
MVLNSNRKDSLFLLISFLLLVFPLLIINPVGATVLNESQVTVKKITIVTDDVENIPYISRGRLVFSDIGSNRLRNLKRIDIFTDHNGKINGVRIVYYDGINNEKSMFLRKIKSIIFEKSTKSFKKGTVHIRVLTTDEIVNPW